MIAHDCAQVERDCVDLHQALAEAIRRLTSANERFSLIHHAAFGYARGGPAPDYSRLEPLEHADLLEVLDRTSRPAEVPR